MYKEAQKVGYLGRLLGKNIGKADKAIKRATGMAASRRKTLEEATRMKGIKGSLGPIKFDFTRNVPKYSKKEVGNMMRHSESRLANLKRLKDRQGDKTFKTRLKTVVGVGGAGALYGAKKKQDEYGIPKMAGIKKVLGGLRDAAKFEGFRAARGDLKALRTGGQSINNRVNELNQLKNKMGELGRRNARAEKVISKIEDARRFGSRADNRDVSNRVRNLRDAVKKNQGRIGDAKNTYAAGMNDFTRRADNELGKSIGLYGAGAGAVYGTKKLIGRKRE